MSILGKVKKFFEFTAKVGLYVPMAYDANTDKPSVTLLAFHLSIILALASIVALHFFKGILEATTAAIAYSCICFVFYRLRNLDKVKFNLKDKSFELEDLPDAPETKTKSSASNQEDDK
jgi:hypothetical protein